MARPRRIEREQIVTAALVVADEHGLDGLTMQAVARRLEVTPMALYRHVADKDDLLDALVERLLEEASGAPHATGAFTWEQRLARLGDGVRRVARRHPAVFPLLLQRPAVTPASRRVRDGIVAALVQAGLPARDAARVERVVSSMVLGFAASEAAGRFRDHSQRSVDADYALLERFVRDALEARLREATA